MKIYGKNACLEALKAGIRAEQIYIENKADEELKNEILSLAKNAQIKYCKKDLLNKMSDFKNHQGILMFCENFKYKNLEDEKEFFQRYYNQIRIYHGHFEYIYELLPKLYGTEYLLYPLSLYRNQILILNKS